MSTLLPSTTDEKTDNEAESQRQNGKAPVDDSGRSWRRRAAYVTGGVATLVLYRRFRGRGEPKADSTGSEESIDDAVADTDGQRPLKRRLGDRATRLVAGFVAASVTKRLLHRRQR